MSYDDTSEPFTLTSRPSSRTPNPAYPVGPPAQPTSYGPPVQYIPPPGYPPLQPPKKKLLGAGGIIAIVIAGIVAIAAVVIGVVVVRSGSGSGEPAVTVGLDQPAIDGGLELTVTSASCNNARVGSSTLGKAAQGQFCLVSVSARNVSDGSKSFRSGNQHAKDKWGTKYDTDPGAELYANLDAGGALFDEINPGNTAKGVLVFDMPRNTALAAVELHGSGFSKGIAVTIPQ